VRIVIVIPGRNGKHDFVILINQGLISSVNERTSSSRNQKVICAVFKALLLFDELRNPLSCDELAAQASDPVVAIEMYTAAVLTLDMNCLVAKEFMAQLGRGLKLPDSLITSIQDNASATQLATS